MVATKSIFKRIESNSSLFEEALSSRERFDAFCLSVGLSPIDVSELLFKETGYNWRK